MVRLQYVVPVDAILLYTDSDHWAVLISLAVYVTQTGSGSLVQNMRPRRHSGPTDPFGATRGIPSFPLGPLQGIVLQLP